MNLIRWHFNYDLHIVNAPSKSNTILLLLLLCYNMKLFGSFDVEICRVNWSWNRSLFVGIQALPRIGMQLLRRRLESLHHLVHGARWVCYKIFKGYRVISSRRWDRNWDTCLLKCDLHQWTKCWNLPYLDEICRWTTLYAHQNLRWFAFYHD